MFREADGGTSWDMTTGFVGLVRKSAAGRICQRADVLASIRNGEYLFKCPDPSYEIELDLFRKTK